MHYTLTMHSKRRLFFHFCGWLGLLWLLAACDVALPDLGAFNDESPQVVTPPPLSTAVSTPNSDTTNSNNDGTTAVVPIPPANPNTNATTDLVIWTIPALSPFSDVPGSGVMNEQIRAFEAANPNINIRVELKEASGPGSINSYLSTARPVAPTILPDVILMPVEQMREAANIGLIFPLNDLLDLDSATQSDLYPAARELVTVSGNLWGYPYALRGMTHTAYNTDTFTQTIPMQLPTLTDSAGILVLPAAGEEGSKILLQYYLESGGQITNENGQPILEKEPLTAALTTFKEARDLGLIHPQSYALQTLDEAWQIFRTGSANISLTRPSIYLNNSNDENSAIAFAPVPGPSSALAPLLSGWAWSISTPDPAKQEIAAEFINWMTSTDNMGTWSEASERLPARRSAFETWPNTPYTTFLQTQTERASAYPYAAYGLINTTLSQNLAILLSPTGGDPALLAEQAVTAVQP